jgi:hypothetical protein
MRRATLVLASSLSATLLAATRPAAAQPAHAARAASSTQLAEGAVERAAESAPRTLATYRFTGARDAAMPTQVTIADSAGVIVASFRLPGDRAARPMAVDLTEADLVLQGETPAGVLTLRFYQRGDAAAAGLVAGRWWLGAQDGTLRGRVIR